MSPDNYKIKKVRQRLSRNVPVVGLETTAGEVVNLLQKKATDFETIVYIYVIDSENRLVGVASIKEVLMQNPKAPIEGFMQKNLVTVQENSHQEKAAMLAIQHNIKAVPVVDKEMKFLGFISPDTILNILHEEHIEDALISGGFSDAGNLARELITSSKKAYFLKRVPWLILGLLGSIAMASIVSYFEDVLEKLIILAAFVPAIVYMSDAVGTQTQTIFIRNLAISPKINLKKYIIREIAVSVALALSLGILMGLISYIWWPPAVLSSILSLSFFAVILTASLVAIFIPFLFIKLRIDPAVATGPFATIVRDLMSIFIYFIVAVLML